MTLPHRTTTFGPLQIAICVLSFATAKVDDDRIEAVEADHQADEDAEDVELGLADGIGHLEPTMRGLFGDKAEFRTYSQRVPFLRRFGISADDFLDAAAQRAAFSRLAPGG